MKISLKMLSWCNGVVYKICFDGFRSFIKKKSMFRSLQWRQSRANQFCLYVGREKLRAVAKLTYYFYQLTNSTSCITGKHRLLKPEDVWAVSKRS